MRDPVEMAQYTLEYIDPEFVSRVKKTNIIVAGENFGTGSSREEAVNVFKILGVKAIIARSFARIYFRNLINLGIPAIISNWNEKDFSFEDKIEISLTEGIIFNITKDKVIKFEKLPNFIMDILNAGGILNKLKERL